MYRYIGLWYLQITLKHLRRRNKCVWKERVGGWKEGGEEESESRLQSEWGEDINKW